MKKPKILGFMTIHYGMDYLRESLLSIRDHVDKIVVAYTKNPSHGYRSNQICPDSSFDIHKTCLEVLGADKLIWYPEESYSNEAAHRDQRYTYAEGYDLILTIDADEVFKEEEINNAIQYALNDHARYFGIKGYVNFFRSFSWACYDGFRPIRIENLRNHNHIQNLECPLTIYHFSTAQREEIMRYKYSIFGHASEIKPNWLNEVFYKWSPENNIQDLHPVSIGLWNAVPFDKETLPKYLKDHPNFNKEII